ncbi:MAG: hypothetical protein V2A53_05415 [bacterium]
MEIFRAIIELINKIVWPVTVFAVFFFLKGSLVNLINSISGILDKKGGKIKMEGPWGSIEFSSEERVKSLEEVK